MLSCFAEVRLIKLKRHKQNPVLEPNEKNPWESRAVFNCGAVYKNGLVYLVYRAVGEYDDYFQYHLNFYNISRLGLAVLNREGVVLERRDKPIFEPSELYEMGTCEDPRITGIDGRFYLTYVALPEPPGRGVGLVRTALASTDDFISFERHGIITPEGADDKDTVLFPEKINGKYVMLHRPHNWTKTDTYEKDGRLYLFVSREYPPDVKERIIEWPLEEKPETFPEKPSIWIAYSDNLRDWSGHKVLLEPAEKWESQKTGAGPPPIKTDRGWLLIYHGVEKIPENPRFRRHDGLNEGKIYTNIYRAGAALLDLNDPSRVIARTKEPILEPEEDYEVFGDIPNVVFPEGMVVIDGTLNVYYGAADKRCCLATCNLDELVDDLIEGK